MNEGSFTATTSEQSRPKLKVLKLIASIFISYSAGIIGSISALPTRPLWLVDTGRPFYSIVDGGFFTLSWWLLYLLVGISLYLIWTATTSKNKFSAYRDFAIQMTLNALACLVFFGFEQAELSLFLLGLLAAYLIITLVRFAKISRVAAGIFLVYLLWTGYAIFQVGMHAYMVTIFT